MSEQQEKQETTDNINQEQLLQQSITTVNQFANLYQEDDEDEEKEIVVQQQQQEQQNNVGSVSGGGGGAQTLQRRKAAMQQQRGSVASTSATGGIQSASQGQNKRLEGLRINQQGHIEYEESKLNEMIRNELGFTFDGLYKDFEDQQRLIAMRAIDREAEFDERKKKCELLRDKIQLRLQMNEPQLKAELLEAQGQQRGRKPATAAASQAPKRGPRGQSSSSSGSSSQGSSSSRSSSYSSRSGSSSSSSRSSGSSSYSRSSRRDQQQQPSRPYPDAGESSEDGQFEVVGEDGQKVPRFKPAQQSGAPAWAQTAVQQQKKQPSQYIESLQELSKIILKRAQIEKWVGEHYNFFHDFIVGTFLKFHHEKKLRIAEVIDCRQNDDGRANSTYSLADGKKKTNLQVLMKYGQVSQWFNLDRISNQEPTNEEFIRMLSMFRLPVVEKQQFTEESKVSSTDKVAPAAKNSMASLAKEKILFKTAQLEKIFREGPPKYESEQLEEMILGNLERKLKSGRFASVNLSHEKRAIALSIAQLENTRLLLKDNQSIEFKKLEKKLEQFHRLDSLLDKAIIQQRQKNAHQMKMGEGMANIEDVENQMAVREWMQRQILKDRNPEVKYNNFFMQHVGAGALEREDSLSLQKQDSLLGKRSGHMSLEDELQRIQVKNQRWVEQCKQESYYQRQKKIKLAHQDFHTNFFNNLPGMSNEEIDSLIRQAAAPQVSEMPVLTAPSAQPHPAWQRAYQDKQMVEVMKAPLNAKFISFDDYFNRT